MPIQRRFFCGLEQYVLKLSSFTYTSIFLEYGKLFAMCVHFFLLLLLLLLKKYLGPAGPSSLALYTQTIPRMKSFNLNCKPFLQPTLRLYLEQFIVHNITYARVTTLIIFKWLEQKETSKLKYYTGACTSENHFARHTNHSYTDFKQSG